MKRPPSPRHRRPALVESLESRRLLAASAFQFAAPTYEASAAQGTLYVYIDRTGDTSTAEAVDLTTSDGTAVAGVDYVAQHYTATFAPNMNSMPIPVSVLDGGVSATPTRSFAVGLSNPTGGASLGTPSTAAVTIDEPLAMTGTTTTVTAKVNGNSIPVAGAVDLGTAITFTAEVDRSHPGVAAPTGTVTFRVDGVAQAPVTIAAPGDAAFATATFATSTLPIGQHTITAAYSGDPSATASTGSLAVSVAQADTVTLQNSLAHPAQGQPLTITAAVAAADPAAGTPTGTFTFNIYGAIGIQGNMIEETATVPLVASPTTPGLATASYTTSGLTVAAHDVVGIYNGDATFAPNTDATSALVGYPTTTTLTASANPATPGQPVVFTALITGTSPQNPLVGQSSPIIEYSNPSVVFSIDGVAQAVLAVVASATDPLVATSQFSVASLPAGPHLITATFDDGANVYNADSVGTLAVQSGPVAFVPTRATLATAPAVPAVGRPYVVIATIAGAAPLPTAAPTGSVEFFDDGTFVATLPLDGNGQAALFIPSLAAGPHGFNVVYAGDANNAGSLGAVAPSIVGVQRATAGATTALVLTVGGTSLDQASARDVDDYQVAGPRNRAVKVRSATYNAAAATVTLRLASPLNLRSTYQLRVLGVGASALRGTNGSALAGQAGIEGTDYQTAITKATPVHARVQVRAAAAHPQARPATPHHAPARSGR